MDFQDLIDVTTAFNLLTAQCTYKILPEVHLLRPLQRESRQTRQVPIIYLHIKVGPMHMIG